MNRSILIALGILATLVLWLAIGPLFSAGDKADSEEAGDVAALPDPRVRIRESVAEPVHRFVTANGLTVPNRDVLIRAETSGRVEAIAVKRGALVQKGDLLVRLEMDDRLEQLSRAQAQLHLREIEADAARNLRERDLQPESALAGAIAALEEARAELRRIELEIENIEVRAPFAGRVQDREVEVGDLLQVGDPVAHIVDLDPLVVSAGVTEREIEKIAMGDEATAILATGEELSGRIRYVSPEGDSVSRTFTVELEAPNPDSTIPAGITARLRVPTGTVEAHSISPALLTLDNSGNYGVKLVEEDNRVGFVKADVAQATSSEIYLFGLPERVRLITVGQGFVKIGEKVQPVKEDVPELAKAREPVEPAAEK